MGGGGGLLQRAPHTLDMRRADKSRRRIAPLYLTLAPRAVDAAKLLDRAIIRVALERAEDVRERRVGDDVRQVPVRRARLVAAPLVHAAALLKL